MTKKYDKCPLCHLAQEVDERDGGERLKVTCPRCGSFSITGTAARQVASKGVSQKLICWVRDRHEAGVEIPEINTHNLPAIEQALPSYRVPEKQLLLLRAMERKTKFPGAPVSLKPTLDYPLGWSESEREFRYQLEALSDRHLFRAVQGHFPDMNQDALGGVITVHGWQYLEENQRASVISDQGFVAMSFASELNAAWSAGIRPALERAGFSAYRVDAMPHADRIDMKIVSEIRNSRFLVADVTGQRPGVYFEAGFAIGLGLPVIWCVRKDDLPNVHFDTRQYNHIVWPDETYLSERLYEFVMAIIGRGGRKESTGEGL